MLMYLFQLESPDAATDQQWLDWRGDVFIE
jgi:hypothetical protein